MRWTLLVFVITAASCGQVPICDFPGSVVFLPGFSGPGTWAAAVKTAPWTWDFYDCNGVIASGTGFDELKALSDTNNDGRVEFIARLSTGNLGLISPATLTSGWSATWATGRIIEDVTFDGVRDILMPVPQGPTPVVSGATGSLAGLLGFPADDTCGDFDGDGTTDWIAGTQVRSGANTSVIIDFTPSVPRAIGDVNGDGYTDVLVRTVTAGATCQDSMYVAYGPTGTTTTATVDDLYLVEVTRIGDADGDGRDDWIAVRECGGARIHYVVSGDQFAFQPDLQLVQGDAPVVYPLGDVTGDGAHDFGLGFSTSNPSTTPSRVWESAFRRSTFVPTPACTGVAVPPTLLASDPVFGAPIDSYLWYCTPGSTALLYAGPVAASPVPIGNCLIHLEPAQAWLVGAGIINVFGGWNATWGVIPADPSLLGLSIDIQAGAFTPAGTLEIANALHLSIGSSAGSEWW